MEVQAGKLKHGFVNYLAEKQAAGIVNTTSPQNQLPVSITYRFWLIDWFLIIFLISVQYIVHIFPPCEFAWQHVPQHLSKYIHEINVEHLVVIIIAQ